MKHLFLLLSFFYTLQSNSQLTDKYVLVIHGGAGTILKSQMTEAKEKAFQAALDTALQKGAAILKTGGSALDVLEKSPGV